MYLIVIRQWESVQTSLTSNNLRFVESTIDQTHSYPKYPPIRTNTHSLMSFQKDTFGGKEADPTYLSVNKTISFVYISLFDSIFCIHLEY